MTVRRGARASTLTRSTVPPVSEVCRPFERVGRRFAGWVIEATAWRHGTYIARSADECSGIREEAAR